MKIEKIRFKNLNSLYGEWSIDLTAPEYLSNGIFVITGATGAGKSTILDAICLALYGSTPRLDTISKSTNEIMSRQTGECFAEVIFRVKSGRYRCHWSQHRSRKKYDGKLSDSKHEISDVETGDILESKKRDVANLVILKTGMDLDRFTRSILLAQGGFAAFLKASADERGPILEQITGTEIYSLISKKIHERQREESEKYQILLAECNGITFLTGDEEVLLEGEIRERTSMEQSASRRSGELNDQIRWRNRVNELKGELLTINSDMTQVESEKKLFEKNREVMTLGIKANELDGEFQTLSMLTVQQDKDQKSLETEEKSFPELEMLQEQYRKNFTELELSLIQSKELYALELKTIKEVRIMDFEIDGNLKTLKNEEQQFTVLGNQIEHHNNKIKKVNNDILELKEDFVSVEKYLKDNSSDSNLIHDLSGISHQSVRLKALTDEIYFSNIKLEKKKKIFLESREDYKQLSKKLISLKNIQKKQHNDLNDKNKIQKDLLNGRLLREYRFELKTLITEKTLSEKIASLKEERTKLTDGVPCPLCGSENHPYALGNIPDVHYIDVKIAGVEDFITRIEKSETEINTIGKDISLSSENTALVENKVIKSESICGELERDVHRIELEFLKLKETLDLIESDFLKIITPYNYDSLIENESNTVVSELKKRESLWRINSGKQESFRSTLSTLEQESSMLETLSIKDKEQLIISIQKVDELKINQLNIVKIREDLYENKNPDIEETLVRNNVDKSEKKMESLRDVRDKSSRKFIENRTKIESLTNTITLRGRDLEILREGFLDLCIKNGFDTVGEFTNSIITKNRLKELTEMSSRIDRRSSELSIRLDDRKLSLKHEESRKLTNQPLDALKTEYNDNSRKVRELGEDLGGLKLKIQNSKDARKSVENKLQSIQGQKVEMENWQKLHTLIGSADGKKYRNFAQGLTFEQMVNHANRELIKMSDRYLLIRDRENPLELNVIDNYQAGEIRSTKNLSGGESFIISLSLALGLSNMASNKVRVDSLFLDEGFGTLDEEALEIALDTLSTLHLDGKLIGVISHIPALKERISTQITVSKTPGGRGIISGPGCKSV